MAYIWWGRWDWETYQVADLTVWISDEAKYCLCWNWRWPRQSTGATDKSFPQWYWFGAANSGHFYNLIIRLCQFMASASLVVWSCLIFSPFCMFQVAKLSAGVDFQYDFNRPLHPYKWVQHLAGVDFLCDAPPLVLEPGDNLRGASIRNGLVAYHRQHRVPTVLEKLHRRRKAHLVLKWVIH